MTTVTTVPTRLSVVTLGARDLARLRAFYERLGWPVVAEDTDYVAFGLMGAVLALFPLDRLADDAHVEAAPAAAGLRGFTLAVVVDRREQVDEAIAAARAAGARITREPEDAELFVGRTSYFADPEDNAWEVVWAPDGSAVVHAIRAARGEAG
jgi:catechol 2,3-dioxygenase-like lactoylglutathione lyase family enzyme